MDGITMVDAVSAENLAGDTISLVREFIESLRTEFRPQKQKQECLKGIPIYTRIKTRGLPQKLRSICHQHKLEGFKLGLVEENDAETESDTSSSSLEEERERILLDFVLPLAELLAKSYKILDDLPESKPPSTTSASKDQRSRRTKNRPAPPRGMLSIHDYTDVACLLEFIVCAGILPYYESEKSGNNNLIEDRLRTKLPKSLAGRIPKDALRWGTSLSLSKDHNNKYGGISLLVQTVEMITRVVVLDRFRPMLLPRHLVDIYGACFKIEYLFESGSCKDIKLVESIFYGMLGLSLPKSSSPEPSAKIKSTIVVDPTLRAMAYQTLLSSSSQPQNSTNGTTLQQQRLPYHPWLQKRVSGLLTDLATKDLRGLSAILTVFVPVLSSSTDQASLMSGASQRLGRTLAAMTMGKSTSLQGRLCQQFLQLLAVAIPVSSGGANNNVGISPRSMAVIQTAWAFFEHLSQATLDTYVLGYWTKCLSSKESSPRIHEAIRQVHALCAFVPPHSTSAVQFLKKITNSTFMEKCLRVAMIENREKVTKSKPRVAMEAHETLLSLTQATYAGSGGKNSVSTSNSGEETNRDEIVVTWVLALGPTEWDLAGHSYASKKLPKSIDNPIETIIVETDRPLLAPTPMDQFVASVQSTTERAEFFVEKILLVLTSPSASDPSTQEQTSRILQGLPSRIFRLLLQQYLSVEKHGNDSDNSKLVATVLLPILCEKCSQEQLLFGNQQENASGLLLLIRQVLSELADARSIPKEVYDNNNDNDNNHRHEFLKSIAGILTSLLIALMEVGSKSRSKEEEDILQSFLPVLQSLSVSSAETYHSDVQDDRTDVAAMADMSAYAMALIASRRSADDDKIESKTSKTFLTPEDRLESILQDAEKDLGSTQAPIRAKGIVSLGRLARGFTGALTKDQKSPSLIQELNESGQELGSVDKTLDDWIGKVLELSMTALSDKESYVFLAAIQTIVAVGDLHPEQVLPKIASAIVQGSMNTSEAAPIPLSQEQVIKLAEALMFTIRRRAVKDNYVPILINLILRGGSREKEMTKLESNEQTAPQNDHLRIQQETANYYATGNHHIDESTEENQQDEIVLSQKERWKEQDIRLKTGGPIFDFEEADVVRSLRISIVSELVASAPPHVLAPYVGVLSKLAIEAMHLEESSRIIQRSAALLARELYARVLKEATDLAEAMGGIQDSTSRAAIPISTALVESDEEVLLATLQSFGHGSSSSDSVPDSTVVARCREAMELREQADSAGVFLASKLVLEERQQLDKLPALLREITNDETPNPIAINPIELLD